MTQVQMVEDQLVVKQEAISSSRRWSSQPRWIRRHDTRPLLQPSELQSRLSEAPVLQKRRLQPDS